MKYIIVSKDEYEGTSQSDYADPCRVTEIATELIITRLYLFDLLQTGQISSDDTIVCIEDRKCLYENIFKNIIFYKHFNESSVEEPDTVINLLEPDLFNRLAGGAIENRLIPYTPFYQNWERDKHLIMDVNFSDLEGYDLSKPFVALVVRKRGAWTEKNMSNQFWEDLIAKLVDNDINVFVFGKETEEFCKHEKVQYVKCYRDWCTVVSNENCMHVASTMTGGVYPLLIFGNSKCKMTIIDNLNLMAMHGADPSFYNSCINFQQIPINFIKHIPTTQDFYYDITANL